MRITADTNILVRAVTGDDAVQSRLAKRELAAAELVALPSSVLCELVWVFRAAYRISRADIAETLRRLTEGDNVSVDRPAVAAGLAVLNAGGDFADGVIAYEGQKLGGDVFLSFDRKATSFIAAMGHESREPASD